MKRATRPLQAIALAIAMMLAGTMPGSALAREGVTINERPQEVAMFFDSVFARPALILSTVIGTGLFAATLPFSVLGGNVGEAANHLVKVPATSAFLRCLGCTPAQHERLKGEKQLERSRRETAERAEVASQ